MQVRLLFLFIWNLSDISNNAVLYYAPSIFAALGTSSNTTSLLATGVVGVAMFLATIPAVLYIDKLGRKPVMITGAIGMGLCHTIIAILFGINQHQWATHKAAGWAAVTMVWLFVVNFGYSWGPCGWVIISEVWPLSNRAYGIALGASSNWMSNFIVGQITPVMLQKITYGTFIFFGILTFGGAVFIWLGVPETKRLTLEEMDVLFGSVGVAEAVSHFLFSCFSLHIDDCSLGWTGRMVALEFGRPKLTILLSIGFSTPCRNQQRNRSRRCNPRYRHGWCCIFLRR